VYAGAGRVGFGDRACMCALCAVLAESAERAGRSDPAALSGAADPAASAVFAACSRSGEAAGLRKRAAGDFLRGLTGRFFPVNR
jgi:hypothetical protein